MWVFGQVFSTENCLLVMIEKLKMSVDNGKAFGALLTDCSKAFNCFSHDLIISKLKIYGFIFSASKLIHNYLSCRKQTTIVNTSYSSWEGILFGVHQGDAMLLHIFVTLSNH